MKMKLEIIAALSLIILVVLTLLLFRDSLTGFAIFQQESSVADTGTELGPFEISISALDKTIIKEGELKLAIKTSNKGHTGARASIRTSLYCESETADNEFSVFLEPEAENETLISLPVCKETGLKIIYSELSLSDLAVSSSSTNIFVAE